MRCWRASCSGTCKGAFTDARSDRKGLFVQAEGGTLLSWTRSARCRWPCSPSCCGHCRRARVRPVGGETEIPFDVRILAATNRDLETAVEERRFREDLFFRINVIQIDFPPLRAARATSCSLAQHFSEPAPRASKKQVARTLRRRGRAAGLPWPGNVRELRN